MASLQAAFQSAFAHHQAGDLRQAEALYRQVLQAEPKHAESWHLLGLVAYQVGRHEVAEQLISRAIGLRGDQPLFHANLGEVLRCQGRMDEAERALRRALALDSTAADAHNNLGNVLAAHGKTPEAISAYRQAIALRPSFAEPHNNLGTVLQGQGDFGGAVAYYRRAMALKPDYIDAQNNLGNALKLQGCWDEAAAAFTRAMELSPRNPEVHLNLGTVHQHERRYDEALRCYREALRLNPQSAAAHNNLASVLMLLQRLDEAQLSLQEALRLDPQLADAYFNLGAARHASQDYEAAAAAYRQTLQLNPQHAQALTNLGRLLEHEGKLDEALALHEQALASDPKLASAHLNRASVYKMQGRFMEAVAGYQAALNLKPHYPEACNNLAVLFHDMGQPDPSVELCKKGLTDNPQSAPLHANLATALALQGRQEESIAEARRAVELAPDGAGELTNLIYGLNFLPDYDPATLFAEHREWGLRFAEPFTATAAPHTNDPTPRRRLRVGYVSPYFREHAVNFFTEPLIAAHDHRDFEIFCYSDVRVADGATRRLRAAADQWREVRYLSDEQLAALIRQDAIDILVDLTGHIAEHRLQVFARKPAPVQVTYIGYQNTTGMSAMDYRLTDERADPPGLTDAFYTERLVRLPGAFFCYQPAADAPEVTPLPALERGAITFGSFNNFAKVTPRTIDTWLDILARVPNSRLLVLANRGGYVGEMFAEKAAARGLDPQRIELHDKCPREAYYKLVQKADIALDPFPFNGHTTTCDAVWLGLPVVMLQGEMYASRFGSSVLAPVGLEGLIAQSPEQYQEIAVELAGDLDRLRALRQELRPRMAASILMDYPGFARKVEAAYRQMWIDWCASRERNA